MRFTITFRNTVNEGHYDDTLTLLYLPGPCFYRGADSILNLAAAPHLRPGGVLRLFEEGLHRVPAEAELRECVVVVHPEGHGNQEDADLLISELGQVGYRVHVVWPPWT